MSLPRYEYSITSPEVTGFPVVSCTDTQTGIIVRTPVASVDRSYPASIAYVGAKFSRSRDGLVQLMSEIETAYSEGKLTPDKRLANIVKGLKHQSPSGMAHVAVSIENIPIITAAALFRTTTLHDGQEASTRYIDFSSGNDLPKLSTLLPDEVKISPQLNDQYYQLQQLSLKNYLNWFPKIYQQYKDHFRVDDSDPNQKSALTARAYDTVRGFLLSGFKTSLVYVSNATNFMQLISRFNADRLPSESQLSASLLALLAPSENIDGYYPEIKTLLNHTEPNQVTNLEQQELSNFFSKQPGFNELLQTRNTFSGLVKNSVELISDSIFSGDKIIAQQILVIHPSLKLSNIFKYVDTLSYMQKSEISKIIFSRRDRFNLPSIASSGGPIGLNLNIDLGIERDLGRHRAFERVSPIHETFTGFGEISQTGFTQAAYLREIPQFSKLSQDMAADMTRYYQAKDNFLESLSKSVGEEYSQKIGIYLLPLAHRVGMIMNSDIHNFVHLQDIRIREGAHIDARKIIASANSQVALSNPLYQSLIYPENRVSVDSRTQFLSRD